MKNLSLTVLLVLVSGVSNAQLLDAVALDSVRTYRKLDRALREPDQVYRLDLSGQKLKTVPGEVFQFKNLNALDLSGNKIKQLPDSLGKLVYLQEFRASHEPQCLGSAPKVYRRMDRTGVPGSLG